MTLGTVLLAAAVGAVALFLWSALCWMALPLHHGDMKNLKGGEAAITDAIRQANPGAGWFIFPHFANFKEGMKDPALAEAMKTRPVGALLLRDGECAQSPAVFLRGLAINFVTALGFATILYLGGDKLPTLGMRLGYVCSMALLLAGSIHLLNSNWWGFPWRNALTGIVDAVSGAAIATLAMHLVL